MRVKHLCPLVVVLLSLFPAGAAFAQSAGTGAIAGVVADSSGAVIPGAAIHIVNSATGEAHTITSGAGGHFAASLLQPGTYNVVASKSGFKDARYSNEVVNVSETEALNITLQVGDANQTVDVVASNLQLQTESSSSGSVTSGKMLQGLPLVTRDFVQVIALSPGVNSEVTNAGTLGRGDTQQSLSSAGGSIQDNNFEMNGIAVDDVQGSGTFSGGNPIPNPDTIEEFNVQTLAYDASYGRNSGANVNVVTKGGTNTLHGSGFEFFRNTAMNANDFFLNRLGESRPVLQQNQFGFTLGGPVIKNKVTFFIAYQGTRQANGYSSSCYSSFNEPALTSDNRTAAGLGALFGGQSGYAGTGGGANVIRPDGSNISPQALATLNYKLPNGQYMVPNAQAVTDTGNPATAGTVVLSQACPFNEDQYMGNADWTQSARSTWQERFFFVNSHETLSLNPAGLGGGAVPGFATNNPNHFRNFTLGNSFVFTPQLLNQVIIGYNRILAATQQATPFTWSSLGVNAPEGPEVDDNVLPQLSIVGLFGLGGNGQENVNVQNQYSIVDNVSFTKGRHSLRFGGGAELDQVAYDDYRFYGGIQFQSFEDFLLGLPGGSPAAGGNGTPYSNVFFTLDVPGLLDRNFDIYNTNLYAQDDIQLTRRFVLNVGFRYERLGGMAEENGRNANTNFADLDPNPPSTGTLQGFEVAGNYPGTAPAGVTVLHGSKLAYAGDGQNTLNPRIGFSWMLPGSNGLVLRAGYGVFHQAISGQPTVQLIFQQPWAALRTQVQSPTASFANPFQPVPTFPTFLPYSPSTTLSGTAFAQNLRPPMIQHYSMNLQAQLAKSTILELGYIGSRGDHLIVLNLPNQAQYASPSNPIRGVTTNTIANITQRLPVLGFGPSTYDQIESSAQSWYNALEASLTHRFNNGLQFLASYTWAKDLSDAVGGVSNITAGSLLGNQLDPAHSYGPDDFIRPQRFVFSGAYKFSGLPSGHAWVADATRNWTLSGVLTLQDGHPLTITGLNSNNVLGITSDFAELNGTCTPHQYVNPGSVRNKVNNYINTSCFTSTYPVVGSDGIATGFGNSTPGILSGPGQKNVDAALSRSFGVKWPSDEASIEFRLEAFNLFNTPQFSDPVTAQNEATFGEIQTSAVAPRILQTAVKINF
jgi:Carboxypeptidase regulatory-like domain